MAVRNAVARFALDRFFRISERGSSPLKLVTGRARAVHWLLYAITAAFIVYFALDWIEIEFNL